MNDRERFVNTLTGRPVDRVPFIKVFGGTNAVLPGWEREHPGLSKEIDRILGFEGAYRGWDTTPVNVRLSGLGEPEVVEETAVHRILRSTAGTVTLHRLEGDYHAQTLEWPVRTRADWERLRDRHLRADDPARFPADWDERVRAYRGRQHALQLTHGGVYGFVRQLLGDERLLLTLYDDPAWVEEMMETYTSLCLALWERMVAQVDFDLIECWEDMASKNGALLSPAMFRSFMAPQYRRIADFARRHGIEIILVDSDGYTDDLAGLMWEAGVTALYPFEVGAGCRVPEARQRYPELGIIGGLDKECMARGREAIDRAGEMAETTFMGLRLLQEGISLARFRARFGQNLLAVYREQVRELEALGLVAVDAERVRLTRPGRLLGNEVFARFVAG
ncbi:MAG: hypothetical protein KJ734_02310 [Chloroflexi bacterium]|nr:hypothetical protein [Chloroflexota bacterium]